MTPKTNPSDLQGALDARYMDPPRVIEEAARSDLLLSMATRGSCRNFLDKDVPRALIDLLCATALAAPSKSDLQQRDIILLTSPEKRQQLAALVPGQAWVSKAPMLLVFCANNRRQHLIHDWRGVPFANDHLDAFFNAATDAAIALGAFVTAAEALGLGCCPISAIRDRAKEVSELLNLPKRVIPFAGLAVGYPESIPAISMRLPLGVTCHEDEYREDGLREAIDSYDAERNASGPAVSQRNTDTFGVSDTYGWSEDKTRQYSRPERADFGAFVRAAGFCLD